MAEKRLRKYRNLWGQGINRSGTKTGTTPWHLRVQWKKIPWKRWVLRLVLTISILILLFYILLGPPLPAVPAYPELNDGALRINSVANATLRREISDQVLDQFSYTLRLEGNRVFANTIKTNPYIFENNFSHSQLLKLANSLVKHAEKTYVSGNHELAVKHTLAAAKLYHAIATGIGAPADTALGYSAYDGEATALEKAAKYLSRGNITDRYLGNIIEDFLALEISRPSPSKLLEGEELNGLIRAHELRRYQPFLWIITRLTGPGFLAYHSMYLDEIFDLIDREHYRSLNITEPQIWSSMGIVSPAPLKSLRISDLKFIHAHRKALALGRACTIIAALRVEAGQTGVFPGTLPEYLNSLTDPFTDQPYEWNSRGNSGTLASPWLDTIRTPGGGDDREWNLLMPQSL